MSISMFPSSLLKINQGYYAKDTDGKNVVIFNIDIALSAESYEQHDVLDKSSRNLKAIIYSFFCSD